MFATPSIISGTRPDSTSGTAWPLPRKCTPSMRAPVRVLKVSVMAWTSPPGAVVA
jgi:hypothetical protein